MQCIVDFMCCSFVALLCRVLFSLLRVVFLFCLFVCCVQWVRLTVWRKSQVCLSVTLAIIATTTLRTGALSFRFPLLFCVFPSLCFFLFFLLIRLYSYVVAC